jgi:hypothetical protein
MFRSLNPGKIGDFFENRGYVGIFAAYKYFLWFNLIEHIGRLSRRAVFLRLRDKSRTSRGV